ncbi:MAG TPA: ACT domain-containing protein, partial [Planctomycetota bacterium]|nr:ACT domain-containing protein [Planctomycetota bacterium]
VGDLALRPTDAVRLEVVAGVLAPALDGPVNAVNAALLAGERGLKVLEQKEESRDEYTALLRVELTTGAGRRHSAAGTVAHGKPRLVAFEGFGIDFEPRGELLLTRHRDEPGVLGQVATFLGQHGINIGGLHMGAPEAGGDAPAGPGEALALYQVSRALSDDELSALRQLPSIVVAQSLSLEG